MDSKILNVGDKVEIRISQKVKTEKGTQSVVKIYKSTVQNMTKDGLLEISMPVENGKVILFPSGVSFEFIFYCASGIYQCVAQIIERYKKGNLYMLLLEPKTPLQKLQRREYYRFDCAIDINYWKITEDDAQGAEISELNYIYGVGDPDTICETAVAVDISGGGIRFVADEPGEKGEYVLIDIWLENDMEEQQLELKGKVLSCRPVETVGKRKYEYRVQFLIEDPRQREVIIKYIFEQERKNRQKG